MITRTVYAGNTDTDNREQRPGVGLFVCLFGVYRPTREFFTRMQTWRDQVRYNLFFFFFRFIKAWFFLCIFFFFFAK